MTRSDAAKLITVVRTLWPHSTVTPPGVALEAVCDSWALVLDVTLASATEAVLRLSQAGERFAPTVGQIRLAVIAETSVEVPDIDAVWAEIDNRIQRVGWQRAAADHVEGIDSLAWTHPVVANVVAAMGGFRQLCLSPAGDSVVRAQLRQAHAVAVERHKRHAAATPTADLAPGLDPARLFASIGAPA